MTTMSDDPTAGLDDAAIEALLSDVDTIDATTDTPPDGWKPPTYAEMRAMEDKLRKANNGAKNVRLRLRELQGRPVGTPAAMPPKPGSPAASGSADPKPVDAAALRAEIEAEYKAKQEAAATQSAAVTALVAAGLKLPAEKRTAAAKRALGLLDLSAVTGPDDTAGIDAAIDDAKASFPGLFADANGGAGPASTTPVKAHQRRLGAPGAAASQGNGGAPLTSAEQLAQKIFGTAR